MIKTREMTSAIAAERNTISRAIGIATMKIQIEIESVITAMMTRTTSRRMPIDFSSDIFTSSTHHPFSF
jgi:hypothetical protein